MITSIPRHPSQYEPRRHIRILRTARWVTDPSPRGDPTKKSKSSTCTISGGQLSMVTMKIEHDQSRIAENVKRWNEIFNSGDTRACQVYQTSEQ